MEMTSFQKKKEKMDFNKKERKLQRLTISKILMNFHLKRQKKWEKFH